MILHREAGPGWALTAFKDEVSGEERYILQEFYEFEEGEERILAGEVTFNHKQVREIAEALNRGWRAANLAAIKSFMALTNPASEPTFGPDGGENE